jgi:DNA-binding NarL/FixJ family response regulator
MDLTIPGGMGGEDIIQELLKLDPQVKAVVSSGYSDHSIMARYQEFGFKAAIRKPYSVAELGAVLNTLSTALPVAS